MFKHVLVPLDGSEFSEKALIPARQVLAPDGTLILLMVIDLPHINFATLYDMPITSDAKDGDDGVSSGRKNAQAYLRRVAAAQPLTPTVTLQIKVCIGDPASVISALARALQVDAIVMSTHGRSGLGRLMFGSVTQRVLALTLCPVIVVPSQIVVPMQSVLTVADAVPSPSL